ncbi:MAG: acyl-CoA dehydrogenase family protein [Alphaproteobacteria bacterium]|nr:acyl-CoA dehydrogenase family protein [Alphaproteobacteria bacterium]
MIPEISERAEHLRARVQEFMDEHVYPNEELYYRQIDEADDRWDCPPILDELKAKAREQGLWNLFLPESDRGAGLTNLEYAPISEVMGRVSFGSEVFNCSAPDTGNMEVLERYASEENRQRWLTPLLAGEIRSAFAMTEPAVASSDATNIESSIVRDGEHYVINGRKWWTSGILDRRCKIMIFMGKTDPGAPRHLQQSMILVPVDTPGITINRALTVYGYDHAPHGHGDVTFTDVRVPAENMLLGEGRGFEIAQGRLGPGRIHHCMRCIGQAERALEAMKERARSRTAFGVQLSEMGALRHKVAEARIRIDSTRLMVLHAAHKMDTVGNKAARKEIAMIKVMATRMATDIIDEAIQVHGGGGVSQEFRLAKSYGHARVLRIADGPDEVHLEAIAKQEFRRNA